MHADWASRTACRAELQLPRPLRRRSPTRCAPTQTPPCPARTQCAARPGSGARVRPKCTWTALYLQHELVEGGVLREDGAVDRNSAAASGQQSSTRDMHIQPLRGRLAQMQDHGGASCCRELGGARGDDATELRRVSGICRAPPQASCSAWQSVAVGVLYPRRARMARVATCSGAVSLQCGQRRRGPHTPHLSMFETSSVRTDSALPSCSDSCAHCELRRRVHRKPCRPAVPSGEWRPAPAAAQSRPGTCPRSSSQTAARRHTATTAPRARLLAGVERLVVHGLVVRGPGQQRRLA